MLWLNAAQERRAGRRTPVGILPAEEELELDGVDITPEDLKKGRVDRRRPVAPGIANREQHLAQFNRLPQEIWKAHRRLAADLDSPEISG